MNTANHSYNNHHLTDTQEILIFAASPANRATCDSCGQETTPKYLGKQEWPLKVADAMGIEPIVTLWQCNHCGTSFTVTYIKE